MWKKSEPRSLVAQTDVTSFMHTCRKLLREVYRILKPNGFLSFYPGDSEVSHNSSQLETIKSEIKDAKFHLENKYTEMTIQEAPILKFRKQKHHTRKHERVTEDGRAR
jgi:ubiquinone/menaquinone biosynthesis C-methylase UbiE